MKSQLDARVAGEVLNVIEDLELPLLSWGVTGGELSREEILEAIEGYRAEHPEAGLGDAGNVLDSLLRAALVFQVPISSPPRYRTRMAEALRLTVRLRQIFGPRNLDDVRSGWWESGRSLVADYRLHVAPRRYPNRGVSAADVIAELRARPEWTELQLDVAAAQIAGRPLARFQVDAATAISGALSEARDRGIIVGAGTGSGKTLAFYLPAFASIAAHAAQGQDGVHTLALYPRKELLRDQLREAVTVALSVSEILQRNGGRRIRIGALYGDTPYTGKDAWLTREGSSWRRQRKDLICPYLSCPRCEGNLLWAEADRIASRDRLYCDSCDLRLDGDIALTRESLLSRPPDLLFTTTEMLNRNASNPRLGQLLGWRSPARPRLVLLDEVHTYAGVHGAQVALLLRRWRNSVRKPVSFVGLSATLRDAAPFFAQLTGTDQNAIEYIEPSPDQMDAEGREYAIALRGDPVSGAGLLSTSIQTAMLYGRLLDPHGREYVHGSVGFLFTDDLDVTNRFYDDLRQAEGGRSRNFWYPRRVLAGLRSPDAPFWAARYPEGQSWDIVQRIGRVLDPRAVTNALQVGRTSSQDAGVDRDADLVVATASLEVGFNDPRVGLVLQHKAPHDAAAFIQRRGRAGRTRGHRPWTVVALSDYGRDRLAYQAYDTLFAPEVPARKLPIGNRFVLKIQGTQALLDWLAAKLDSEGITADPRDLLRAPAGNSQPTREHRVLINLLSACLRETSLQDELTGYLRRALQISATEAQAVLWEQPRALLLTVVPTALRRLISNWKPVTEDPGARPRTLLPDFITTALFDALNVPEVWLELPFGSAESEVLPIERALREAVPGRVSRRYGYRRDDEQTWLPLPGPQDGGRLDITTFADRYSHEGSWEQPGQGTVRVVRPIVIRLARPGDDVLDQAQGRPLWESQIIVPATGLYQADIPDPSPWAGRVTSAGFATHAAGNPVQVRRMTPGAQCETTYRNGQSIRSSVRYALDGEPAALGFHLTVDAIRFELAPLDLSRPTVAEHLSSPAWRTLTFAAAVAQDPDIEEAANVFQRGWLTLVYLTAFALVGVTSGQPAEEVHAVLAHGGWGAHLTEVLRVLYRDDPSSNSAAAPQRLVDALTSLSANSQVTDSLDRHGRLLWAPDVAEQTSTLAQRSYRDTVAAALLAAALRACPDAQEQDLIVDVMPSADVTGRTRIWLTETSSGGLGLVEQLAQYYGADPRRFWGLVDSSLGPNDYEYVDGALTRLLDHVTDNSGGPAAQAMQRLRTSKSAHDADAALRQLRNAWTEVDGYPRHSAVAALSTRLLRPGSSPSTDAAALGLVRAWDALQGRLGFEIDARVIAAAVGSGKLTVPGVNSNMTGDQVFSLLWPRGSQAQTQHLRHYQPYADEPLLDRQLAAAAHDERLVRIDVTAADWQQHYIDEVGRTGAVKLTAPVGHSAAMSSALRAVPAIGIDRDVLRVYGEVRGIVRFGSELQAVVDVREAVQ
jgi:ATP-dependent Lhr-like helicase